MIESTSIKEKGQKTKKYKIGVDGRLNTRKYLENMNGDLNIVGKKIQERREKLKYSRQYVSDRLMNYGIDISPQSLYHIEIGTRTIIDYELGAIAMILKTSTDEFMKDFYKYLKDI